MDGWEFDQWFNFGEALWWMALAAVLLFRARIPSRSRMSALAASAWFFLFGISDLIEIHTRAWFRPWPLLLFKTACVLALVLLLFRCLRQQKSRLP
jgi:hypothetical protein